MFAGLIFARDETADGAGLVATLPFAGATVIETQARRLVAAGASRLFVVAARVPAELSAALDRARRGGIAVELLRKPADLAERLDPAEPLLVVADGVVVSEEALADMARAPAPALLAVSAAPADTALERIDPQDHWAGVALVDAALVERTVSALGEWDLQSTLLRRTAQAGATRHYLALGADPADHALIASATQAASVDGARMRRLVEGQGRVAERLVSRWIAQPLAALARRREVPRSAVRGAAVALGVIGVGVAALGWSATGMLALLAAAFAAATARIAALHGFDEREAAIDGWIGDGIALAAVLVIPIAIFDSGPAPIAMAFATASALVLARRARGDRWQWAPTPVTVTVLLALGALFGMLPLGLALVGLHGLASLAYAIERLRARDQG